jgi:translation initiation factor RLI1
MLLLKRIKGAFMGMSTRSINLGNLTDFTADAFVDPTFNTEVIKPMQLEVLLDQEVQT